MTSTPGPVARSSSAVLLSLLLGAPPSPAVETPAAPEPGALVPDLTAGAAGAQRHRYARYLPEDWTADRRRPVLIVLDPRGRAVQAAEIFRPGAERFGWIVLSSYDSRSDLPPDRDPNSPALEALLRVADELAGDPQRTYLAGFSGTSKFAWGAARGLPGAVAGVIGCGGALPGPWEEWNDVELDYFGAAGDTDFNHRSMRELDELLDGTGVAHRFEYFPGRHQWLGAGLAAEAIGWLELQAMKRGLAERDVVVIERLYERRVEHARSLEEAGAVYPAWRAYRSLAADFDGLRPTTRPAAAAERLAARPGWQTAQSELTRALAEEKDYRARLGTAMRDLAYQAQPKALDTYLSDLEIEPLRQRGGGDSFTAQAARRQLELAFIQTAYYMPRALFASGAPRRAALSLEIAAAIRPNAAETHFQLARAHAQSGEEQKALTGLERAIALGFTDRDRLRSDAAFTELRQTRPFKRLLSRLP